MSSRTLQSIVVATASCILAIGIPIGALLAQRPAAGPPPAALVEVKAAEVRNLPGNFTFVGTVNPARRAVLGSAVDGRLEAIIDDGVWVEKGAPIARLRTNTITIEIQGAEAERDLRQHEVEEIKNGSLPEEKQMAAAKLASTEALEKYAQQRYERILSLFERGQATSKEEVEQAHSALEAAKANRSAAAAENELAIKGPRAEKVKQADDRLLMQQEAVNHLHDRRNKYLIRPYFNGYVTTKYAEVGAWIKQGDPLVEVIELTPVEITVNVPEKHISQVYPDMPAEVRIDGVSLREAWTGTVVRIVPQADLRSRTFAVKVRLENQEQFNDAKPSSEAKPISSAANDTQPTDTAADTPEADIENTLETEIQPGQRKLHKFKAGMLAHVSMRLGEKRDVLLIPKDALVLGGSVIDGQPTYRVYVAKSGDGGKTFQAQPVQVSLGGFAGDWAEVVSQVEGALVKGSQVVTEGNERLQPGQAIRFNDK